MIGSTVPVQNNNNDYYRQSIIYYSDILLVSLDTCIVAASLITQIDMHQLLSLYYTSPASVHGIYHNILYVYYNA